MEFLNNFIITQNSPICLLGLVALTFGAIFNFSFCGLFKNSQKISNFITFLALLLAIFASCTLTLGFLSPISVKSAEFFNYSICFNFENSLSTVFSNIFILASFLICTKFSKRFRHKAHYLNTLILIVALCADILLASNNFLTFFISLETTCLCAVFIIFANKTASCAKCALNFLFASLFASVFMLLGYGVSFGFEIQNQIILNASKIAFIFGYILKSGLLLNTLEDQKTLPFGAFCHINLTHFAVFILALPLVLKFLNLSLLLSNFFIVIFILFYFISCAKLIKSKDILSFIKNLNCANFFFFITAATKIDTPILTLTEVSYLTILAGIFSAFSIFHINYKNKLDLEDFSSIFNKNPIFTSLFASILYINALVLPSSALYLKAKILGEFFTLIDKNLAFFIAILLVFGLCAIIYATVNFTAILFKSNFGKEKIALKKRTKLNYFILLISNVLLLLSLIIPFMN